MRDPCTPIRKDKRFLLASCSVAAVLVLAVVGREPSGEALTFMGGVIAAYMAQSQWGQTRRAAALAAAQTEDTP